MAAAPKLMTLDDYLATPETVKPAELAFGVLRVADSPRIGALNEHLQWFAEYGVSECCIVHQDKRTVTVVEFVGSRASAQRMFAEDEPIVSRVLPGFGLSLREILER